MSGSAIADLAATGRISIDMMTRNNRYPVSYAAAVTAASAVIGPIIPPSIPMVLYALVSDTSVGYLFLGGIIPGLLMALAQMVINTIQAHRHDYPVETADPAARMAVHRVGRVAGATDAGHSARRYLQRRHDPDRSCRGRGCLRVSCRRPCGTAIFRLKHAYIRDAHQCAVDRVDRHADFGRSRLQLRGDGRADPGDGEEPLGRLRYVLAVFLLWVNIILLGAGLPAGRQHHHSGDPADLCSDRAGAWH